MIIWHFFFKEKVNIVTSNTVNFIYNCFQLTNNDLWCSVSKYIHQRYEQYIIYYFVTQYYCCNQFHFTLYQTHCLGWAELSCYLYKSVFPLFICFFFFVVFFFILYQSLSEWFLTEMVKRFSAIHPLLN